MSAEIRSARELTHEYIMQHYQLGLLKRVDLVVEDEKTQDTGELILTTVRERTTS